jgi:phosphoglycolate phosphatase-like HAD superfamily hydrolase
MKKVLLFDLDETLISTAFRQYSLIIEYCNSIGIIPKLTYEEYLLIRRNNLFSNSDIAGRLIPASFINKFKDYFRTKVETNEFLAFDKLIVDIELLKTIKENQYETVLVSLRSNEENSINQLNSLKLIDFLDEVYFLKHQTFNPKTVFLSEYINNDKKYIFIGDSDSDYEAANKNGIDFKYVNTGIYPTKQIVQPKMNINQLLLSILHNE